MLSRPRALDGFEVFIAVRTLLTVKDIEVMGRLSSCLKVLCLVLLVVKLVGFMKCLLKELAISLLEVMALILKFFDRLGQW